MENIGEILAQAQARHAAGDLRRAEQLCLRVLAADNAQAGAHFLLGVTRWALGQPAQATDSLERAVRLQPMVFAFHEQLGVMLALSGNYDRAIASFRKTVELDPGFLAGYGNLGNLLRFQGQFDAASACYRRVLQLDPTSALAHNDLGLVAHAQGLRPAAAEHYRRALALDGNLAEAYRNLGTVLAEQGQLAEAVANFRRAAELQPDSAEAHCNLGAALANGGELESALASCRRATELDPRYPAAWFNLAVAQMRLGQLAEAADNYRRALQLDPGQVDALHNLGIVLRDQEQFDQAVDACTSALKLRPDFAEAHVTLGTIFWRQERRDLAAECWRRAIVIKPDYAEAYNNLAVLLREQDQPAEAEAHVRRALELRTDFADAQHTLGLLLAAQGRYEEAAESYRRAVELKSDYTDALFNLAVVLTRLDQHAEAIACYRRVIESKPAFVEAHRNLGLALAGQGLAEEAVACYRRAIELAPEHAETYNNLAVVLTELGKLDEAVACYRRTCELQPVMAVAHLNLAAVLAKQGKTDEARQCYQTAIGLNPEEPVWKLNLISLCPAVFSNNRQIDHYRAELLANLTEVAASGATYSIESLVRSDCRPSFNLQFHGRNDRAIRQAFAEVFRGSFADETPRPAVGKPRIGFVVTNRHERVFIKSLGGVLNRLSGAAFDIFVIASPVGIPQLRALIPNPAIQFVPAANTFEQSAQAIREARLDVLYYWEIGTDSLNYFLPYLRLAPMQCTSWGIQVTSGIPTVDYYLSSKLAEPENAHDHYSEHLLLADTLLTFQERVTVPSAPKSRTHFNLSPEQHVYLCAQQLGKLQPDFDAIMAGILRRDPQGVVVSLEDRNGEVIAGSLRRRFAATIPDVAERIVFLPFQRAADYRSLIAVSDVLLDPLHFGGVNSTYDGLSLSKPIVTLPSSLQRGRYTLACYRKMEVMDCVASSDAQYVDIAVALGTDAALRAEVEAKIERAAPVLFDDPTAVSEHERLFAILIEAARAKRPG